MADPPREPSPGAQPWPAAELLADGGVDRAWLNGVLLEAGFEGRLAGCVPTLIGTGQMAASIRCSLDWEGDPDPHLAGADGPAGGRPPRPASVVVKLPSPDETSRATGGLTGAYAKEIGFYRDAAASVAMRVPRVHHLWEDKATSRFVLVLEDITPAETGDQLTGCSVDRARLAVDAAADLHGSTWGRADELAGLDWLDRPAPDKIADRVALFVALFPGFVDRYRDRLSPDDLAFGEWLAESQEAWLSARTDPQCLVHGDYRLDNLLFGLGAPAPPIATVDWQTASLGSALADVAYFLSGSLDPPTLAHHEADLLDRWRRRLAAHGVEVTAEAALDDYRLGAPSGYVMAVIASQLVVRTERGDRMFGVMATGSAELSRRLDTPAAVS